jgi:hypothetical protein
MLRMLKVLRMMRQTSMSGMIEQRVGRALTIVLRTFGLGLLLLHLVASIFHWIAWNALNDQAEKEQEQLDAGMAPQEVESSLYGPNTWTGRVTWIESSHLEDATRLQR